MFSNNLRPICVDIYFFRKNITMHQRIMYCKMGLNIQISIFIARIFKKVWSVTRVRKPARKKNRFSLRILQNGPLFKSIYSKKTSDFDFLKSQCNLDQWEHRREIISIGAQKLRSEHKRYHWLKLYVCVS